MLLLDDAAQAATIGVMGAAATALADAFWPGGLTVIVPRRPEVPLPAALTGGAPTIGLRVPDHDAPRALARGVGPLPTTSANVSGLPEARDAAGILDQLGDGVDLILDGGPAHGGPASTVVDCTGARPVILREGAIPTIARGARPRCRGRRARAPVEAAPRELAVTDAPARAGQGHAGGDVTGRGDLPRSGAASNVGR